jgi:type IV pilus assembly protein PilQ
VAGTASFVGFGRVILRINLMNIEQMNMMLKKKGSSIWSRIFIGVLFALQITIAQAQDLTLKALDFSALSGNKLQLQLEMSGTAVAPKVFQTDNPARLALDFQGVKSGLKSKKHTINIGAASSLYAVEASGRLRVVINLLKVVPYDIKVEGNMVYVTLNEGKNAISKVTKSQNKTKITKRSSDLSRLIPQQTIEKLDFRRGANGEGRLLISLSNPNTVVNAQEVGDKIVLNFLNTTLPPSWAKRMDVIDFATPVKLIDAASSGMNTTIAITPVNANYQYSSFQADGMLTVEFRPLTSIEQEMRKVKFPYEGERLSLNFQDIEVRSVLQILADFTELNIIASDTVSGNVTLRLNDVPWDQALHLVLKSKGLAKRKTGNVIMVAPIAEISKMEQDELESKKIELQLEPLITEHIKINYARAENFRNLMLGLDTGSFGDCGIQSGSQGGGGATSGKSSSSSNVSSSSTSSVRRSNDLITKDDQFSLLTSRGVALVDSRTNTLIVRETAGRIEEMKKLINRLDVPVKQVLIEARVVSADESFIREIGTRFGVAKTADLGSNKQFGLGGVTGFTDGEFLDVLGSALEVSTGGTLAMTLARGADYVLNLEITALQDEGDGESISNPRILTSDRCEATIKQGVQIPYISISDKGTVTELIDAVLELKVTPQITPSGKVIMDLKIKKDEPGTPITAGGVATVPINKKEIQTNVHVMDGETIVLGGVYEGSTTESYSTVPWLADLPGIGWMFQKRNSTNSKKELLIFITPKIVKETMRI